MRLIDADVVPKWLDAYLSDSPFISGSVLALVQQVIKKIPTENAIPMTHGKWVWDGYVYDMPWKCSKCGYLEEAMENYCPNCGAKMDGDKNS